MEEHQLRDGAERGDYSAKIQRTKIGDNSNRR